MASQDNLASLVATAEKLVHPLAEVRRRAVQSLDFKLKHRLLAPEDIAKERAVLKNLLGCLQYDDNGVSTDAAVLMLLAKVAALPGAARQVLHLGGEQLLSGLQQSRSEELQPAVSMALTAILAAPRIAGSQPATPAALQSHGLHGVPLGTSAAPGHWSAHTGDADRSYTGAGFATQPPPSEASAAPIPAAATLRLSHNAPPPPAFTYNPTPAGVYRQEMPGGPAIYDLRSSQGVLHAATAATVRPPVNGGPASGAQTTTAFGRTLRTRQGAERHHRQNEGTDKDAANTCSSSSQRDWVLQSVSLGQADDQELFELSLRLKYMDDPRIALPALIQLHGASLVELPVEAVVARHDVVNHLLALITASSTRHDMLSLAAQSLLRIVVLLKRALLLATDPMYNSPSGASGGCGGGSGTGPAGWEQSPARSPGRGGASSPPPSSHLPFVDVPEKPPQQQQQDADSQRLLPQALPKAGGAGGDAAQAGVTHGSADGLVNASRLAYLISLQVFNALRDPQRLFVLAPLAEELMPLLLVGREGALAAGGSTEQERTKWSQLLQALSKALIANLSIARAESPPVVQAIARDGGAGPLPPLLNAPSATILSLAARLLTALPRELCTPEFLPPALIDTLAAIARDDILSELLQGMRDAILPVLSAVRPDAATLLDVAAAGEAALEAGETLVRQVPLLRSGDLLPECWLQQLQQALPALHLPQQQETLMEAVVQGLALVCGCGRGGGGGSAEPASASRRLAWAASPGGAHGSAGTDVHDAADAAGTETGKVPSWIRQAEELFLALLSHDSSAVSLACYSLLESLVQEVRSQPDHPLPRLLTRQAILEHLVVVGLTEERTRRQVARILLHIMPGAHAQKCLLPWTCWVRLYESDPQVGALAAALAAASHSNLQQQQQQQRHALMSCSWPWLRAAVLELYSGDAERRRTACRQLAGALQALGCPVAGGEPHSADPFRVCLDGGARDDLVVPAANPRLARSFRPADVANLLSILANSELALELRRSAAEQMLALAAEERLREVLEEEASLRTIVCVAALRDPASGAALTASQAGSLAVQGLQPPSPDLLSTLDVQLPIAAVNLLFVLAAHSSRVRAWLTSASEASSSSCRMGGQGDSNGLGGGNGGGGGGSSSGGGLEMLQSGVLPLVFHSMVTVRRAVARLFATLCFGTEADRWSGWAATVAKVAATPRSAAADGDSRTVAGGVGGGNSGRAGDVLLLPQPFQRGYCYPCRVTWVGLPVQHCQAGKQQPALAGKPRLQDLVSEQRQLVVLLIQERQALRAAGGDAGRLLALMNERPDCLAGLSPAALHTLAASIRAVAPAGLVSRCLAAVRSATSHAECTQALRGLQLACSTRQGVAAFATADWQVALENLLATCPSSPEDRALWLELLELLRRCLVSGGLNQPQLLQLALYFQQSALSLLSAPDASVDPPALPIALAGSAALPAHSSDQHAYLACTQAVLSTLVELVRCVRMRLPLQQALRVLLALSPTQLLRTLGAAYIGNGAANYGCRALSVQLLQEMTALLAAAHEVNAVEVASLEPGLQEALLACLAALLNNIGGGFAAGAASAPQLAGGLGGLGGASVPAVAAERARERQAGGFAGKGAVRLAMHCLLHLTSLLPVVEWTSVWQQLSGSFWVSRLLRDRDWVLRSLAAEVLARLMQPGAEGTHAMVAQGWPDAVKMMAKAASDRGNCYALRAAALRVLGSCMAQEAAAPSGVTQPAAADPEDGDSPSSEASLLPRRQLFSSTTSLPPAAWLLQHATLWAQLPAMLREPDAPAPFLASALALLLQGLLLDGEGVAAQLGQPGLVDRLLQLLDVRTIGDVMGVVWPQGSGSMTPAVAAAGSGDRAAVLAVLGSDAESCAEGQAGGLGIRGGGSVAGVVGTAAGLAAASSGQGATRWADVPAAMQLEMCAGIDASVKPRAEDGPASGTRPTDPNDTRHHLAALRCAALAAQLLAHTQQDPPLLSLPSLGLSPAAAAAALLGCFARLASCVAAIDATHGSQTASQAAEGMLRLAAARQAAAAGNAVLQLLAEDEAHQALVTLNALLSRAPGPLLCQSAEVLLAACSPRPLRMEVVCLLATLLARRETAARLLHFELTEEEYLVGSTGKEVGAGLCAALLDLLPDGALAPVSTSSLDLLGSPLPPLQHSAAPDRPPTLSSDSLCIIVALRNLLAHSSGAKMAALRAGYHRALIAGCSKATTLLGSAVTAAQQAASGASGAERKAVGSVAASPTTKPAPAGRGARQPGSSAHGPRGHPGLRKPSSAAAAAPSTQLAIEVGDAPSVRVSLAEGPQLSASLLPRGGADQGRPGPKGPSDQKAAARRAIEQKVVASLSLLKHMAHGSAPARQLLVRDGLVALLRALWPCASAATSGPLFHELLGCATNLLPDCAEARSRVACEGGGPEAASTAAGGAGTLLGSLLGCVFGPLRLETPTYTLLVGVLLHFSAAEDGVQLLLKSPFPGMCQKALQDMANAPCGGTGGQRLGRDLLRQAALLQVLGNLAAWSEGQRALLKSSSAPGLLEVVIRMVASSPDGVPLAYAPLQQHPQPQQDQQCALRNAALALLRNLCFAAEAKTHLLAQPAVLPSLVAAVEGVADNPQGAAYAASGLWSLVYHGEKVKAALRRVPSAVQRLVTSLATARFQEARASARLPAASPKRNNGMATGHHASKGVDGEGPTVSPSVQTASGQDSRCMWLQQAVLQLSGLLEALQATSIAGSAEHGEHADRSSLRDQEAQL
ncbi:hypothetical protein Agub_g13642 [Astrephomene gubernaculifera]|uniref:Rotatin N-terminal domain-containing protein n=1 Tax=Astrephomene gubernaculifera TaxID=47775 RepID=A0AAD3E0A7_9CHLO|nr:hypothetical protein Agub_g13642 [Astrephomene gubernaculifera]